MNVTYEVWPPKGDRPFLTFTSEAAAVEYAANRKHVVPGLRVERVITTVRREVVGDHAIYQEMAA